ncbi:hypothetical protein HLH36_18640 [Gluconacetobacter aggeris]|uniref:Uncharacterized protein n=1 Tax=Gluconacetobacter aggeris TaxID=1286186 RepID=A0A7W4IWG2_9PROT|nr:hypothetical protein [Gluconacetobacter aggeris]MBB2170335.1 hypothetical protein [Gluconacetobacter aggeris]
MRRLHVPKLIAGILILVPTQLMANSHWCYKSGCTYTAADVIIGLGSHLPRRIDAFEVMTGETIFYYTSDQTSHFSGRSGSYSRLHRPLKTEEGIVFDTVELFVTNPPYVSEIYFHVDYSAGAQCLREDMLLRRLSLPAISGKPRDFEYSPVIEDLIKFSATQRGADSCVSSIELKYRPIAHARPG